MGWILGLRNIFNERCNGQLDSFAATLTVKVLVHYRGNNFDM